MGRRVLKLNGADWWLGQAPAGTPPDPAVWEELERVGGWLPATVPGNVHADLVRAGRLPDLFFGMQAESARWVDDYCWWLIRDCALSAAPGERVHLVLSGVDYIHDLFLNGQHLGRHEGMFSPWVYDVTTLLRTENRLAVRLIGCKWLPADRSSPWLRILNRVESKVVSIARRFPQRRDTLKCQMSFGWDFSPPLPTVGVWDDVYAIVSGDVYIRDVAIRSQLTGDSAYLSVHVDLDAGRAQDIQLRCTLAGETFDAEPLVIEQVAALAAGASHHTVELQVPQPHLWWPWDHGRPELYRLITQVWAGGQLHDSLAQTIGLRHVELEGWTLRINGQRVYARGANWVPANILPGRVGDTDYSALLMLARQANMNMLRVWGGGLREKRAFYDLCDRMGILVWQEFPLACAFLTRFPRSPEYLHLVRDEARAIVRGLRNHPSLILWCGGNEFDPRRNQPLVRSLQQVVAEQDPARPFLPASPAEGDSHNWQIWHRFQPPSAYRKDRSLFASEFGLQAPPRAAALRRFLPPDELWPPGPSWAYHGADLKKLVRYAQPFLHGQPESLEAFVQASQRAQADGLQIALEHYRRHKANGGGGALVWQLNEPWPAISWALVSHDRQPKPAYETVKRLFEPLLVSLDYPLKRYRAGELLSLDLWIVNDRHQCLDGCRVEVVLWDEAGEPASRAIESVDITADSAMQVGHHDWALPPGTGWQLTCALHRDGQTLTYNQYDLSFHDGIQPTLGQRLWAWLIGQMVPL